MSSIYSLYKELLPPTAVEACAQARFLSPYLLNLIVARGSVLQVYNVVEEDAPEVDEEQLKLEKEAVEDQDLPFPRFKPLPTAAKSDRPKKVARLELHSEHRLHGNVTSIGVVRTSTSVGLDGMDSLLLSFKDAKVRNLAAGLERIHRKVIDTETYISKDVIDRVFYCDAKHRYSIHPLL
ncbi:mRNA cleavage and polyadenylation factor subunit [Borealophlyctis nickersoniae]|nr:mRNA cleavage and polyadenylation factor subunit [Borealophlyctis nickersoniae]